MRASVIVPAFNEEQGLAASLRSIRQAMGILDIAGWSSELIVCDNNSTDRTAAIAREEGAARYRKRPVHRRRQHAPFRRSGSRRCVFGLDLEHDQQTHAMGGGVVRVLRGGYLP